MCITSWGSSSTSPSWGTIGVEFLECMKKYILALFGILTLGLVSTLDVFADGNPTYTLSSDPSSNVVLCDDDSPSTSVMSSKCSDYSYLTIDATGFTSASTRGEVLRYGITSTSVWTSSDQYFPFFHNKQIISLNNAVKVTVYSGSDFSSGTFSFTLSSQPIGCTGIVPDGSTTISSNGTYDVTNLSSVTVDIPVDLPPFIQIIIDAFWEYHVYFAGAVVSLIAIFLVYRLLRGRLR